MIVEYEEKSSDFGKAIRITATTKLESFRLGALFRQLVIDNKQVVVGGNTNGGEAKDPYICLPVVSAERAGKPISLKGS